MHALLRRQLKKTKKNILKVLHVKKPCSIFAAGIHESRILKQANLFLNVAFLFSL